MTEKTWLERRRESLDKASQKEADRYKAETKQLEEIDTTELAEFTEEANKLVDGEDVFVTGEPDDSVE